MITIEVKFSYLIFGIIIILASAFASLAQKYAVRVKGSKRANPLFWTLSFCVLFFPAAFRGNGIDQINYLQRYYIYTSQGIDYIKQYRGQTEPLYLLVNYLAEALGGFQWIYILESAFCLFFVYKALERKIEDINLGIGVLLFTSYSYLFLFGLVRMSFAFGLIMYALRYIEEKNLKKYLVFIILAMGFHYSAICMLLLYFVCNKEEYRLNKEKSIYQMILGIIGIILFFCLSTIIIKFVQILPWLQRYSGYFGKAINWRTIFNVAATFPTILILFIEGNFISKKRKYGNIYVTMVIMIIPIAIASIFINFIRIAYYLYPAVYYITSYAYQEMKDKVQKAVFLRLLIVICLVWYFYSLTSEHWKPFLIPYVIGVN